MIDVITHPAFLWTVGCLLVSGLLMWILTYIVASYCVYNQTLRRRSKEQWSREVPEDLTPDALKMYETGLQWAAEHAK